MNELAQLAVAAVPGALAGIFALFQATRTAKIGARTTEAVAAQNAAIERARVEVEGARVEIEQTRAQAEIVVQLRTMYEGMIGDYRAELDRMHLSVERMQAHADKLGERLTAANDENHELRRQIRVLQLDIAEHRAQIQRQERLMVLRERQIEALKAHMQAAGMAPPDVEEPARAGGREPYTEESM